MIREVTATSLNLRAAPNGQVLGPALLRGVQLDVIEVQDGWAHVDVRNTPGRIGWVKSDFTAEVASGPSSALPSAPPPAANVMPPADTDAAPVRVVGEKALGPDGTAFARRAKSGFVTMGETSISRWLANLPAPPAGVSASATRVLKAMSVNEGRFEAINSYDGCHISFGILQWTAGLAADEGELAALLAVAKAMDADAFQDCFGRYGLDTAAAAGASTGGLILDGAPLRTTAQKDVLRSAAWAYRFWRAGHHASIRLTEFQHAARRIERARRQPFAGRHVSDWLTSEYGVALILDEHVNRPGHVPGTLQAAVNQVAAGADPAAWGTQDELNLIEAYLDLRDATRMTDSRKRADRIGDAVRRGDLSEDRESYVS